MPTRRKSLVSRWLGLVILGAFTLGALGPVAKGVTSSAVMIVHATVMPDVAVSPVNVAAAIGAVRQGDFSASVDFMVEANQAEVCFQVAASALYLGTDPTNSTVAPIPVNLTAGVTIQPQNGNAVGGHSNTAMFQPGDGPVIDGFPTVQTEIVCYSSSQAGYFSQDVNVKVTWNLSDMRQPTGDYGGVIQLTAIVLP